MKEDELNKTLQEIQVTYLAATETTKTMFDNVITRLHQTIVRLYGEIVEKDKQIAKLTPPAKVDGIQHAMDKPVNK